MKIKYQNREINLGPLTSVVVNNARWFGQDAFPSSQLWADEIEKLLSFAETQRQFERYLGDLISSASKRDSCIAELRVAFYFHRNQFGIIEWEPVGLNRKRGEFLIRGPSAKEIFVEVKSPGWESELSDLERKAGRTKQPKYQPLDGRAIAPWKSIQFAIDKAYTKYKPNLSNLLVIADDLFVSLRYGTELHAKEGLYDSRKNKGPNDDRKPAPFTSTKYEKLGGAGIFWEVNNGDAIWYEMKLFLNPYTRASALPDDFIQAFHGGILTDNSA